MGKLGGLVGETGKIVKTSKGMDEISEVLEMAGELV